MTSKSYSYLFYIICIFKYECYFKPMASVMNDVFFKTILNQFHSFFHVTMKEKYFNFDILFLKKK